MRDFHKDSLAMLYSIRHVSMQVLCSFDVVGIHPNLFTLWLISGYHQR